jgi:hypothetical protein
MVGIIEGVLVGIIDAGGIGIGSVGPGCMVLLTPPICGSSPA